VDPDRALMRRIGRLPPLDGAIERSGELLGFAGAGLAERLEGALADITGAQRVELRRSGRDALCVALRAAADATGRDEVVLPAFTCWTVAAAAVAARLRVRLADVGASGALDAASLRRLPLGRAAAVVACNLFGIAESLGEIGALARAYGTWLIDDAAQSFGARAEDGLAGTRGDVGILSFGRGKPLQALGGGALLWFREAGAPEPPGPPAAGARNWRVWLRARLWNAALTPLAFRTLAALPGLHVGETRFDPKFARGAMPDDSIALCLHALAQLEARRAQRTERALRLAREISAQTAFAPILPPASTPAAFARLAVRAPDGTRREAAVASLAALGAAAVYPAALGDVPALHPALVGDEPIPGARALAACGFTLPTHAALRDAERREVVARLAALAPRD
jgi:dTDP-4-amino-4,6-dideoxygalactose transaminase